MLHIFHIRPTIGKPFIIMNTNGWAGFANICSELDTNKWGNSTIAEISMWDLIKILFNKDKYLNTHRPPYPQVDSEAGEC